MTQSDNGAPVSDKPAGKLVTLEAGRFFAATAVLLYHLTAIVAHFRGGVIVFGDIFRPGHVGVPYFFVLSGFIIYHVHRGDLGQPKALGRFAIRRAIRLYPMFWLISLAMLAGFVLVPSLSDQRALDPLGIAADLLLLPHGGAILPISWTLRHEMVFYALFACAIRFGPRAFWAVGAWILVSFWLGLVVPPDESALGGWSVIAGSLNLGFGLGMIVAELVRRRSVAPPLVWVGLGGLMLILLWVLEWNEGHGVDHSVEVLGAAGDIAYLIAAAILIYGLVKLEKTWRMPLPGLWKVLGGASYLIYLIHQPIASVTMRALRPIHALPPEGAFALAAIVSIGAAVVLHLTVERWVLRKLNGAVKARDMRTANAAEPSLR